jgi:hypothetical protein
LRSNPRRIDQIVDQLSLRARAAFDGFERVSLRVFIGLFWLREFSTSREMALSGERSSCETKARKKSLARLASRLRRALVFRVRKLGEVLLGGFLIGNLSHDAHHFSRRALHRREKFCRAPKSIRFSRLNKSREIVSYSLHSLCDCSRTVSTRCRSSGAKRYERS